MLFLQCGMTIKQPPTPQNKKNSSICYTVYYKKEYNVLILG